MIIISLGTVPGVLPKEPLGFSVWPLNDDAVRKDSTFRGALASSRDMDLFQWPQVIGVAPDVNEGARDDRGVVPW